MYVKPVSYSGLTTYEECPHRWADSYIHGNWDKGGSAQANRGLDFHTLLENYFKGAMYPSGQKKLAVWRPFMEDLKSKGLVAEGEVAVNELWQPVGYKDPAANARGKIDGETPEQLYDWKSGKFYEKHKDQALFYVAMRKVRKASFVYLDIPRYVQPWTFTEGQVQDAQGDISERVRILRADEEWPARPSEKNCRWCKLDWRKGGTCTYAP